MFVNIFLAGNCIWQSAGCRVRIPTPLHTTVRVLNQQSLSLDEMVTRNKDLKIGVLDSMRTSKRPADPGPNRRTRAQIWPWLWLALTGVATVGWLIAIRWATVALAKWILD